MSPIEPVLLAFLVQPQVQITSLVAEKAVKYPVSDKAVENAVAAPSVGGMFNNNETVYWGQKL